MILLGIKKMKLLTCSFLLWFSICLPAPASANGEPPFKQLDLFPEDATLLHVLKGYSNKFSVGIVLGQEYRFVKERFTEEVRGSTILKEKFTVKSRGIITLLALKYQIKDYLRAFGSYGYSHREFFDGSQVASLGWNIPDF